VDRWFAGIGPDRGGSGKTCGGLVQRTSVHCAASLRVQHFSHNKLKACFDYLLGIRSLGLVRLAVIGKHAGRRFEIAATGAVLASARDESSGEANT
jgi:hypothetical protein